MRSFLVRCIPMLLIMVWQSALTKTLNLLALPPEKAISIARQYVADKHIDLSNHFLDALEYINLHSEYERPFWRVEWRLLAAAKGGQIIVLVYSDGTAELRYGE